MRSHVERTTVIDAATHRSIPAVSVVCQKCWVDWPVVHPAGDLAFDDPEMVPKFLRALILAEFDAIYAETGIRAWGDFR